MCWMVESSLSNGGHFCEQAWQDFVNLLEFKTEQNNK